MRRTFKEDENFLITYACKIVQPRKVDGLNDDPGQLKLKPSMIHRSVSAYKLISN